MDSLAIMEFAHNGYVYCMLMAKGPTVLVDSDEEVLISGGGDGTIKLWRLRKLESDDEGGIEELMVLGTDDAESVLSLAIDGSFLYAGKLQGVVELWDLDTKQKLRVLKDHPGNVMALQMGWGCLWSASTTGSACVGTLVNVNIRADRSRNTARPTTENTTRPPATSARNTSV